MAKKYDPDERFALNIEPEEALESDSPRESWRVIPLRGLLHVKKHPILTRVA
jgi:hypothetical protein